MAGTTACNICSIYNYLPAVVCFLDMVVMDNDDEMTLEIFLSILYSLLVIVWLPDDFLYYSSYCV